MPQIVNTIIAVFLAFTIVFGSTFLFFGYKSELRAERITLNEMDNLMDKVKDTGRLTPQDRSDFYLALASTGVIYDVEMNRKLKVINPVQGNTGQIAASYILMEDNTVYNKGDLFELKVTAVNYTGVQRVTAAILNLVYPKFSQTQVRVVENG